jgi:hypothetical protein
MSLVIGWLAACEAEEARLKAELQPYKDGTIHRLHVGGVDRFADHIAWIEADIVAVHRHMRRLCLGTLSMR